MAVWRFSSGKRDKRKGADLRESGEGGVYITISVINNTEVEARVERRSRLWLIECRRLETGGGILCLQQWWHAADHEITIQGIIGGGDPTTAAKTEAS